MYCSHRIPIARRRRGFVLLAVLIVIVLLSLAAYQFAELTTAEYRAAASHTRSVQARALAASGIDYAAMMLSSSGSSSSSSSASSTGSANSGSQSLQGNLYSNPTAFQGIAVNTGDSSRRQGRFSIVSPPGPDDVTNGQSFHFGASDESGKINLNAVMQVDPSGNIAYNMLMQLPNMTADVANSILDWIDKDDEPRANGAEEDYYQSLSPPYHCKNGPLDSVEELLLVKGVTPALLLGNDRNRNGALDPGEDDGAGAVQLGWAAYLTVYSREQNLNSQGKQRIFVNDSNLDTLHQNLVTAVGQQLADYIAAYRQYGPAASGAGGGAGGAGGAAAGGGAAAAGAGRTGGAGGGGAAAAAGAGRTGGAGGGGAAVAAGAGRTGGGGGGNTSQPSGNMPTAGGGRARPIASLFDLINSSVSIPASTPGAPPTVMQSPLNDPSQSTQLLPVMFDQLTTVNSAEIPARININTAPAAVLAALPGIAETDAQTILERRPDPTSGNAPDAIYQTPAWLITQANLSPKTLSSLDRYITAQSQVYRVQAVGYFDGGGPSARIEAVIDTNQQNPRILMWRDLTDLGRGYDMSQAAAKP
jgi:type II secretory pathway component PulK